MTCRTCSGTGSISVYQSQTKSRATYRCSVCFGTGTEVRGVAYAGIGSRKTPDEVCSTMTTIGMLLAMRGLVLRSGKAKQADQAFEKGCDLVSGPKTIRAATEHAPAMAHAALFHPAWNACDDHAKALHARNSQVMLGDWLDDPVRFVVCWTPNGAVTGGTGQALRIAAAYKVPVFNVALPGAEAQLWEWLGA